MLFQVLCGFEPIFYTTHPNEEPIIIAITHKTFDQRIANNIFEIKNGIAVRR